MAARSAKHLMQVLLQASEKSAKIARAWRCQEELFQLMVEEKTGQDKNKRFIHDFKTLADVLVQEVVKRDVTEEVSWIDLFTMKSAILEMEQKQRKTQCLCGINLKSDVKY